MCDNEFLDGMMLVAGCSVAAAHGWFIGAVMHAMVYVVLSNAWPLLIMLFEASGVARGVMTWDGCTSCPGAGAGVETVPRQLNTFTTGLGHDPPTTPFGEISHTQASISGSVYAGVSLGPPASCDGRPPLHDGEGGCSVHHHWQLL